MAGPTNSIFLESTTARIAQRAYLSDDPRIANSCVAVLLADTESAQTAPLLVSLIRFGFPQVVFYNRL